MEKTLLEMIENDRELIFLLKNIKKAKDNNKDCDISFQVRSGKVKKIGFAIRSLFISDELI